MSEYKKIKCPACEAADMEFMEVRSCRFGPDLVLLLCQNCGAELTGRKHLLEKEDE